MCVDVCHITCLRSGLTWFYDEELNEDVDAHSCTHGIEVKIT